MGCYLLEIVRVTSNIDVVSNVCLSFCETKVKSLTTMSGVTDVEFVNRSGEIGVLLSFQIDGNGFLRRKSLSGEQNEGDFYLIRVCLRP